MSKKMQYGLALGGGGIRGAYQAGVAKALKELKIDIILVSGTSIGAINGAFIVQNDIEKMIDLYRNIKIEDVFSPNIDLDTSKDFFDFKNIFKVISQYIKNNGLDNTALKNTLENYLDIEKIYKSKCEFGMLAFSLTDKKADKCFKNEIPKDELISRILASACFPFFKAERIKGEEFLDGGIADVIPINMLIEKGIKNIIAVDIEGPGITRNTVNQNVFVRLIHSKEALGGLFEFNKEIIERNINMGYLDTLKEFNQLQGHIYYFKPIEFYKLLKQFNVQTIYGLECAANIYGINKYKIYTAKEFLSELRNTHFEVSKKYNEVKDNFDISGLISKGQILEEIGKTNLGICIVMEILELRPTFRNNKIIVKNLYEYLQASDAMYELIYKG